MNAQALDSASSELHHRLSLQPVLVGCSVDSASGAVAEMVGMLGYDMVWADLEHSSVDLRAAEEFCRGAKAGGAIPMLRVSGSQRVHILHALDAGATVVVVPMVNSPEVAEEVVRHGKYAPVGDRGYNGVTRGLRYGIGDRLENMQRANQQTNLFVQIETVEAARCCAEIVAVQGVSGGLVGPADLSISMGKPLAFDDPEFVKTFRQAIRAIRHQGKIAATVTAHRGLIQAALDEDLQILVCAAETVGVRNYFDQALRDATETIKTVRSNESVRRGSPSTLSVNSNARAFTEGAKS